MQTVYQAAGGRDWLLRLASAWHTRVLKDEVVSHAFSHGYHAQHTERLAAYWGEALGGPTTYSDQYGDETSVVRIHSGNGPHEEMDQRAIACFDQALEDVGLARDEQLRRVLPDYFAWATTTIMSRYHHSADECAGRFAHPEVVLARTRQLIGNPDEFCRAIQLFRLPRQSGVSGTGYPGGRGAFNQFRLNFSIDLLGCRAEHRQTPFFVTLHVYAVLGVVLGVLAAWLDIPWKMRFR